MPFDLRADVAEVPREKDEQKFTLNLKLAKQVRELRGADEINEAALAAAEAELAEQTYTAEMVSVPRRRREDIYEASLEKFPNKSALFTNQVDEKTQFERNNFVRVHLVAASILSLTKGADDKLEDEAGILDAVQFLHDEAPDQIFEVLERKSNALNTEEDEQDVLNKSADF